MSRRVSHIVTVRVPAPHADGIEQITVQVRVHFPPRVPADLLAQALERAVALAAARIAGGAL